MRESLVERFQSELSDRYTFERELGRGGMATVYLAQDKKHDRPVAVKVLSPDYTTALGTERFLREIRITAQLQHPHILTLIDSGEAAGLCYYVMPFVEGESLRDKLLWTKQLKAVDAIRIAREVASALAYAHGRGIVHRDIKPENILLSDGTAIVADFGVARAVNEARNATLTLTVGGLAVGTPAYMSPEQAAGRSDVDGRTDVYGLGCVLYEMLAGQPPFVGPTAESVIRQHVDTPAPSVASIRHDLSPELVRLVARALAKDPAERFASAGELHNALRLSLASEVVHHATPGAGEQGIPGAAPFFDEPTTTMDLLKTGARPRGLLLGGAAVAVLACAVLLWAPWGNRGGGAATATPFTASIAVMPLDHFGSDKEGEYLSEGLTDEIISELSRIKGLKVISRTSVVAIKARHLTVPQIARELKVRHVLEGSVQRSGERIRVTLQLIDAKNDAHLWANSYERELTDVFSLREEIAGKVAGAMADVVPGVVAASDRSPAAKTKMCTAYDAYLEGKYWLERPSPEAIRDSIKAFETAIFHDPNYAPAYANLSMALRVAVQLGYRDGIDPYRDYARAVEMAEKAVRLDPSLPDGYVARGSVRLFAWAPPELAMADMKRAVELMPNSGALVAMQGVSLARAGRYDEALKLLDMGSELNPLCPNLRGAGVAPTALGARRPDLALRTAREADAAEPKLGLPRLIEALSLLALGRPEETARLDLAAFPEAKAMSLRALGRVQEAEAIIAPLEADYRAGRYTSTIQLGLMASYHASAGDVAATIEWLEHAFAVTPTGLDFRVIDSSLFDRVRQDPRFAEALARLQQQARDRVFPGAKA